MKPLAIDLYAGLGGWAEGFISEGYEVIGFDIERHDYGTGVYPGQLVIQDVLTLHGSQFKDAAVIVASPPCQAYSYRGMPWNPDWIAKCRMDDDGGPPRDHRVPDPIDNQLFMACFRIQREACEAAGRHIPLIVENVCKAQRWVGRAKWHYGSYYLWGDVPALMPIAFAQKRNPDGTGHPPGSWFAIADSKNRGAKIPSSCSERRWEDRPIKRLRDAVKGTGSSWFTPNDEDRKPGHWKESGCVTRCYNSKSPKRKAASAEIAKIPFPLAQHIARCFRNL